MLRYPLTPADELATQELAGASRNVSAVPGGRAIRFATGRVPLLPSMHA